MLISRRWNKFWIGLAAGIVLPLVVFILVYFIGYSKTPFYEFLEYAFVMGVLPKILSLCVFFPNLAIFHFFLNREFGYATRGIITATLLHTLGVVVIIFFV